jgi:CRP-like cAMP-binding protein
MNRATVCTCWSTMALICRRPRSADCVAPTGLTALRIDQEDFWELMDERPALAQGVGEPRQAG